MLPKLRKSLQKNDQKRVSPPSMVNKTSQAIEPPKAVIKALYDYTQGSNQELSFHKGDFFHVVGNENDNNWYEVTRLARVTHRYRYEACNPATGARGLVPAQYFQVLGRNVKDSIDMSKTSSHDSGYVDSLDTPNRQTNASKSSPLYGIVQYDFQAERPDELDAKAGEAIIVIAQSNHEWFVAKPIGRLGGPGLIPVSFIEIRDMATGRPIGNLEELAAKAAVPKVEEWKKAAAEYKKSSIPLGRFDFDRDQNVEAAQYQAHPRMSNYSSGSNPEDQRRSEGLYVMRASVDQFLLEGARYWFLLRVEMNDGRHRNLCRFYEDFYDFQIALLEAFPVEAGRTGEQRILPFMPGPLTYVDDTISAQRRADLSIYVEELCRLPPHVVRSGLVQALFAAREGDVESSHPTSMMPQAIFKSGHDSKISGISQRSSQSSGKAHRHSGSKGPGRVDAIGHVHSTRTSDNLGQPQPPTISNNTSASLHRKDLNASNLIKIKVFYEEDLIAIRLPMNLAFNQLCDKLNERLSGSWSIISVKDDADGAYRRIERDQEFQEYLSRNDKIVLYVQ